MLFPDCTTHMQSSCLCNCAVYLEACQSVWAWKQVTVPLALRLNHEFMVCTCSQHVVIFGGTGRGHTYSHNRPSAAVSKMETVSSDVVNTGVKAETRLRRSLLERRLNPLRVLPLSRHCAADRLWSTIRLKPTNRPSGEAETREWKRFTQRDKCRENIMINF